MRGRGSLREKQVVTGQVAGNRQAVGDKKSAIFEDREAACDRLLLQKFVLGAHLDAADFLVAHQLGHEADELGLRCGFVATRGVQFLEKALTGSVICRGRDIEETYH